MYMYYVVHIVHVIIICSVSGPWWEWLESLPASIAPPHATPPPIWRGHLHVHEHKTKQGAINGDMYPGFSLSLVPSGGGDLDDGGVAGLVISHASHPAHLEVVDIIDTSTIPTMWLSPHIATLYPMAFIYNVMCMYNAFRCVWNETRSLSCAGWEWGRHH